MIFAAEGLRAVAAVPSSSKTIPQDLTYAGSVTSNLQRPVFSLYILHFTFYIFYLEVKYMRAIVTVIAQDRVGIIASVCSMLAENGVNILDISQTVLQEYFTMIMLVDAAGCSSPFSELTKSIETRGNELGLSIRIQREDIFEAMHRI